MPGKEPSSSESSFQLYFNEVFLGHNSILIEADDSQTVFIFVITFEVTLSIIRRCEQWIKLNRNVALIFIVEVNQLYTLITLVDQVQGCE